MKTDEELIRDLRSGEPAAFDTLVDRHYGACLRLAWLHLGQREDAEDVVQDALIRAYRALRRGDTPHHSRAWLLGIVLNRCRSHLQKVRRRRLLFERWWARQDPASLRVEQDYGAETFAGLDPKLQEALSALSPALREALLLRYVEDLTYDEMSMITGVKVSALKMRVKRATDRLREWLLEES